jgi:hypothetical protein
MPPEIKIAVHVHAETFKCEPIDDEVIEWAVDVSVGAKGTSRHRAAGVAMRGDLAFAPLLAYIDGSGPAPFVDCLDIDATSRGERA